MIESPSARFFLSPLLVLLGLSAPALAGDFYIDPVNGLDQPGRGTSAAAAWRTIPYAIQRTYGLGNAADHTFYLAAVRHRGLLRQSFQVRAVLAVDLGQ